MTAGRRANQTRRQNHGLAYTGRACVGEEVVEESRSHRDRGGEERRTAGLAVVGQFDLPVGELGEEVQPTARTSAAA